MSRTTPLKKLHGCALKACGKSGEHVDCEVLLSPLHLPNVVAVAVDEFRQFFLRILESQSA